MSQLHHDRPVDQNETAPYTVRTQRMGDALPSDPTTEEPRLTEVTDLADLTGRAEATARAGIEGLAEESGPISVVPVARRGLRGRLRGRWIPLRSEERRVGKECRSRRSPYH